jgi:hypothetical protein
MPPLPRQTIRPRMHHPMIAIPPPHPRAHNHAKHNAGTHRSTIRRLADREAVRVVRATNLTSKLLTQVPLQRLSVQPRRIRILHKARRRHDRPGVSQRQPLPRRRSHAPAQTPTARSPLLFRDSPAAASAHAPSGPRGRSHPGKRLNLRPTKVYPNSHQAFSQARCANSFPRRRQYTGG